MRRFRLTPLRLAAVILIASFAFCGIAYAASLGLSSNKLWSWGQTLNKGTCNQTSSTADDTYVQQSNPASTGGATATTLAISPTAGIQNYAFIRFDLSGCSLPTTAGADSATLSLYVTNNGADTISLYPVYSSWNSTSLAWNGLGGLTVGSTATTTFSSASNGAVTATVTADVDAAIKAGTLWGWELRATSGAAAVAVGASENPASMKRPSLAVSYEN
jgi:hypothetical protein